MATRLLFASVFCLSLVVAGCSSGTSPQETDAVFVTINDWTHKFQPNSTFEVPVVLTTRGKRGWEGEVRVYVKQGDDILAETRAQAEVPESTEHALTLSLSLPEQEGTYEVVAEVTGHQGQTVKNRRLIEVDKPLSM